MLEAAELYAAKEGTVCGESKYTEIGDVLAAAEVDSLETLGRGSEAGDDRIRSFVDAREVDCDQVGQAREDAREGFIRDGMAVDKGEALETIALGETGEEGVGEVGAKKEKVETTDETSVGEGLVGAGENAHHLDESGETSEGGPVPKKFYRALAPGARYEESVIDITL